MNFNLKDGHQTPLAIWIIDGKDEDVEAPKWNKMISLNTSNHTQNFIPSQRDSTASQENQ